MPRLHPSTKHLRILVSAILLTVTGYLVLSQKRHHPSSIHGGQGPASAFQTLAQARLRQLQARFQDAQIHDEVGLKVGNPAWDGYVTDLEDVYDRYFQTKEPQRRRPVNKTAPVERIRHRLGEAYQISEYQPPTTRHRLTAEIFPPTIHTTSLSPVFPEQFSSWASLNGEDGWKVRHYDNAGIWRWMRGVFGGTVKEEEDAEILREYERLPSGVLRADFFRYLVLLMEGGIYTDTDTACIRPLRDWPGLHERHPEQTTRTDPMLSLLPTLPQLVAIASSPSPGAADMDPLVQRLDELDTSYEPPKLVVALEHDHWAEGVGDWREAGHSRGMQFVQWTMLAQPGHPVFLDTLGRIMRDLEEHRVVAGDGEESGAGKDKGDMLLDVLDFTGPGVFSDAVFRYLLARWGVHPKDLSGASGPIRVGDVLIYPMHSFRADASEQYQGEHKLVWHGFFGTWKDE